MEIAPTASDSLASFRVLGLSRSRGVRERVVLQPFLCLRNPVCTSGQKEREQNIRD